jgi:hypothetical protein
MARQYHCDYPMDSVRIPLQSGGHQVDFTCNSCGHREREFRNSSGTLTRWVNLSVKAGLAEGETVGV